MLTVTNVLLPGDDDVGELCCEERGCDVVTFGLFSPLDMDPSITGAAIKTERNQSATTSKTERKHLNSAKLFFFT